MPIPRNTTSVKTIDLHVAGEPCRVLFEALHDLPGDTMRERLDCMKREFDDIRRFLMQEPRGHKAMFGSVLMRPATPDADVGILYMNSGGYLDMCIHGTICSARVVAECGMPLRSPGKVVFDAVCGRIEAELHFGDDGKLNTVSVRNVPSFVFTPEAVLLDVEGIGTVPAYIVFAGNFFVCAEYPFEDPLSLKSHGKEFYIDLGMRLRAAANRAVRVAHPTNPSSREIALSVFWQRAEGHPRRLRDTVVFGDGQMDRSPCGSGTSALMTLMHHFRELDFGEEFISESLLGTRFKGRIFPGQNIDTFPTVIPEVSGVPFVTACCEFFRESEDPFRNGFLIS